MSTPTCPEPSREPPWTVLVLFVLVGAAALYQYGWNRQAGKMLDSAIAVSPGMSRLEVQRRLGGSGPGMEIDSLEGFRYPLREHWAITEDMLPRGAKGLLIYEQPITFLSRVRPTAIWWWFSTRTTVSLA